MAQLRSKIALVVAAVAMLAAACGSADETTEAGSPLAEFLGQDVYGVDGFDEDAQARFAEEERLRQEKVAACMKEQGFDYVPRDNSDFNFVTTTDGLDYDSREYAEKYGFGITTERFSQEEVGPELVGHNYNDFEESFEDDPNNAIVEAMDQSTQEAYYEALYGNEDAFPSFDPETMSEEELAEMEENFVFEPQGCEGEAWAEDNNNAFYQDFSKELQKLYEAVEDDPRLQERQDEISECVAGKGFEFNGLDQDGFEDLYGRFESDLNRIEEMLGGFPGENLTEEDFAAMTEDELDALFNQPREFTPEAKTLLGELQVEETELATAVFDCGGSFAENQSLYQEVSAEYEEQFLADNADRLAEYKADE